jgi:hypothetical protein
MLAHPGESGFAGARWSVGMRMEEEGAELEIDARTIGNMFAQELHAEVFSLEQGGIAAASALGADSSAKPLRTMHRSLGDRFHLRHLLFGSEVLTHVSANSEVAGEIDRIHSGQ